MHSVYCDARCYATFVCLAIAAAAGADAASDDDNNTKDSLWCCHHGSAGLFDENGKQPLTFSSSQQT